jgi:HEAT repeat protein
MRGSGTGQDAEADRTHSAKEGVVSRTFWSWIALLSTGMVAYLFGTLTPEADPARWDLKPPAADAVPVTAPRRLPGIYPAGSRIADPKALGGFGRCDNYPRDLGGKDWGIKGKIALVAFPDEIVAYFSHKGIALRLVNRSSEVTAFAASDSCLFLVQEARDEKGRWREIELPPQPFCGNSFHRVFLQADQYLQFPARLYSGSIKTKIRFRLDPSEEPDAKSAIYSGEFDGFVAPTQFRPGPDRMSLAQVIKSTDPKAAGVMPVLIEALEDDNPETGCRAARKLAGFGPAAREAVPALLAAVKSAKPGLQAMASYALWRVDDRLKEPIDCLVALLGHRESEARYEAAVQLHAMGSAAREAVPALCAALSDSLKEVRKEAAQALAAIHAQPAVAVPALANALKDPEWIVRCYAAEALGQFGAAAASASDCLREALRDKESHVQVDAALSCWKIEGKTERALPVLLRVLNEAASTYAPQAAAEALGQIGPPAKAALHALTAALQHEDRGLRIAAAGAVWKIAQKREVVPLLAQAILQDHFLTEGKDALSGNDGIESGTANALQILEAMGPQAKEAVPTLLAVRKLGGQSFQVAVAKALRQIDPEAARKAGLR